MSARKTASEARDALKTVRDLLRHAVSRFNEAGLVFGHGNADAWDEAVYLVLHRLHLPLDRLDPFLDARVTASERDLVLATVAERVIVPRSFIAELLFEGLAPWVAAPDAVSSVLDLCTGSGCLAIIAADVFSAARVDAVDLSVDALAVARVNVDAYALSGRVRLVESNLYEALPAHRYDLIISNPPYVNDASMALLPAEYRREPRMALAGGSDGLDLVRRILAGAAPRLTDDGLLIVEVGHERAHVEAAFPALPCTWLSTSGGDDAVFSVEAAALKRAFTPTGRMRQLRRS